MCVTLTISFRDAPTTALRQKRFHFIEVSLACLQTHGGSGLDDSGAADGSVDSGDALLEMLVMLSLTQYITI
jgi:hypothetical protein